MEKLKFFLVFLFMIEASCSVPSYPNLPFSKMGVDNLKEVTRQWPPANFTFQIFLSSSSEDIFCLASLAEMGTTQFAITAATCLGAAYQEDSLVPNMVLSWYSDNPEIPEFQARRVVKAITHEDHDFGEENSSTNNIAILFFEAPFILNQYLQPAMLPGMLEEPGSVGTTLGYDQEPVPIGLKVLSDTECAEAWKDSGFMYAPDEMFCAQKSEGGPLEIFCYLEGVAVVGADQCMAGFVGNADFICQPYSAPPVYIQVSRFIEWIGMKVAALGTVGVSRSS